MVSVTCTCLVICLDSRSAQDWHWPGVAESFMDTAPFPMTCAGILSPSKFQGLCVHDVCTCTIKCVSPWPVTCHLCGPVGRAMCIVSPWPATCHLCGLVGRAMCIVSPWLATCHLCGLVGRAMCIVSPWLATCHLCGLVGRAMCMCVSLTGDLPPVRSCRPGYVYVCLPDRRPATCAVL